MKRTHDESENVDVILTIVGGLMLLYVLRFSKLPKDSNWHYLLLVALVVAGIGLFSETGRSKIVAFWIILGETLGKVMPKLIFGLMFWVLMVPLALLSKLFGSNNNAFKKPKGNSFYVVRNKTFGAKDLENPW
jgi:hypothetical protein